MASIDVVVIGGGHAGVEAAAAASRKGASTVLVSQRLATIGAMSCNPSIGGVGKGHIVREIDAFDGLMAVAADAAGIHHRMLNQSKGAAVHGPRVQADRRLYAEAVSDLLQATPRLRLLEGEVDRLVIVGGRVTGVDLSDGTRISAGAVVIATGTFLGGRIFRGEERLAGGRLDDAPATRLASQLREITDRVGTLKTGTPPRLDGRTIDWAHLTPQPSDGGDWTMSSLNRRRRLPPVACAITRTNERTHAIIAADLGRSPLRSGAIGAAGPRYCPSIEDKIDRFGDRDGHQIFLEPEGLDTSLVYPNGISTSMPTETQTALVGSIVGLERARIVVPGYAVEYDYLDPRGLDRRLAARWLGGLFLAGQINGTTGYEEAAGQGLVAGLNAAAEALGDAPVLLERSSSYLGVMIDDLTLQGVSEPYRMLTARAEFRLSLRADNAESRLGTIAAEAGSLSPHRWAHWRERMDQRDRLDEQLRQTVAGTEVGVDEDERRSLGEWLRRGDVGRHGLIGADDLVAEAIATARYAPYVERQAQEVRRLRQDEAVSLPIDLDYRAIAGLSTEMVERLDAARPETLGAASRVRGVTPAALAAVLLHTRRKAA